MAQRVWFITGASSGFGRALAVAAAERGDTVIAAARRLDRLQHLVDEHPGRIEPISLDVTDAAAARAAVADAFDRHGAIDVLANVAGHGQVGAAEETTDDELRALMELQFFAAVELTKAVLPRMRERGTGSIVQMSSQGGQVSFAGFAAYCATKFALEAWSVALADEVAPLGIDVLIVEPGAFRTELQTAALVLSDPIADYDATVGRTREFVQRIGGSEPGDPAKGAAAILQALDADQTPLRLVLGGDSVDAIRANLTSIGDELDEWEHVSRATDFD